MKRILSLIFAVCLTVVLTVSVSAASNKLGATAPAGELKAGDTVKITVSLSAEDAFKSIGLTMKYDSNAFTLESGKWILKGTTLKDVNESKNQAVAAFSSEKSVKDDIFEFTLKVKSGVYTDSYTVAIEPVLKKGSNVIPTDSASVTVKVNGVSRPTSSNSVVSSGVSSVIGSTDSTPSVNSSPSSGKDTVSSTVSYTESFFESVVSSDISVPDDTDDTKDTEGADSRLTVIIVLVAVIAAVAAVVTVVAVKSKKK